MRYLILCFRNENFLWWNLKMVNTRGDPPHIQKTFFFSFFFFFFWGGRTLPLDFQGNGGPSLAVHSCWRSPVSFWHFQICQYFLTCTQMCPCEGLESFGDTDYTCNLSPFTMARSLTFWSQFCCCCCCFNFIPLKIVVLSVKIWKQKTKKQTGVVSVTRTFISHILHFIDELGLYSAVHLVVSSFNSKIVFHLLQILEQKDIHSQSSSFSPWNWNVFDLYFYNHEGEIDMLASWILADALC